MEDIILYHGSKGGLIGEIKPTSRRNCDFGKGFYMGTNKKQAEMLVCENRNPYIYTLKLKLSEIDEDKILVLKDEDWLNAILSKRKMCKEFSKLKVAKHWNKKLEKYDVIIGKIADDRMLDAMERFSNYGMTDIALQKCLQTVDYGLQYVIKTELACSKIEILDEKRLHSKELDDIRLEGVEFRRKGFDAVEKSIIDTRGQGLYLDEIVRLEIKKYQSKKGR